VGTLWQPEVAQVSRVSVSHLVGHSIDVLDLFFWPTVDCLCSLPDCLTELTETDLHVCKYLCPHGRTRTGTSWASTRRSTIELQGGGLGRDRTDILRVSTVR